MNDLKFLISHATSQSEIVAILKQFHRFDYVVQSLRTNYRIGYNPHPSVPNPRRTRLDKLKICIIAVLDDIIYTKKEN